MRGQQQRGRSNSPPNYDDKGIFEKSKEKNGENSPDYWGVVDVGEETLNALMAAFEAGKPAKLRLSGWRSDDNPSRISLRINAMDDKPRAAGSARGGGGRGGGRSYEPRQENRREAPRRAPPQRREEHIDPEMDDDAPF